MSGQRWEVVGRGYESRTEVAAGYLASYIHKGASYMLRQRPGQGLGARGWEWHGNESLYKLPEIYKVNRAADSAQSC